MNINSKESKMFNPASSWEATLAGKLIEDEKAKTEIESFNGDENLIKEFLLLKFKRHPKIKEISLDEIINELKKAGVVKPAIVVKEEKVFKKPEHIGIEIPEGVGLKVVEDEELKDQLERNSFLKELEKAKIFENEEEFNKIYNEILSLEKEKVPETIEDYLEFAKAGLIKGGEEEVRKDFKSVEDIEERIKKDESGDIEENKKSKKTKKIATITELGLKYGVSELAWYGKNLRMKSVCKINDFRGIDKVVEIIKEDAESSFLGLGIDVTFRGLYSPEFKKKFFALLKSIRDGYKTKIKYFKNHNGEMMKEFSVPRIITYFNINDVKNLVYMIKNINDPKVKEEFKNSRLKFTVMNQIINQCSKLSVFAEESKNDIFKKYIEIINSIKELAWENKEIKEMLNVQHDDETSMQMDRLIEEFKSLE